MGTNASTAGLRSGDDTKRKRAGAALIAVLWPSVLGPEHGEGWRAQNRRIWRRRLTHLALIATITGIGAIAAAPPYQRHSPADVTDLLDGADRPVHRPPMGDAGYGYDGGGAQRLSITLRTLRSVARDFGPLADLRSISVSETAEEHGQDAAQGPDDHGPHAPWTPFSPTPASFVGGGYRGGFGGSGGGGSSSSGPSQGDATRPGDPGQQTQPDGPQTPDQPVRPPYIVDPDDGPPQPGDPPWPVKDPPPKDWAPQTDAPQFTPSPVPEPAAWLMMIGGFAAIGASLRTRRRGACCAG